MKGTHHSFLKQSQSSFVSEKGDFIARWYSNSQLIFSTQIDACKTLIGKNTSKYLQKILKLIKRFLFNCICTIRYDCL